MLRKKLLVFICLVFLSHFVYINGDLNLQENHNDEMINSQQDIISDKFEDEGIHPPQRASCRCSNGQCVMEGGKEVCKCPPGYGNITSTSCKECQCGPGSSCMWTDGVFGSKICLCKPGFGEKGAKCIDCECGPDSNCTFTNLGFFKGTKKDCICKPGYSDQNGKCVGPCSKNPCKNGGTCTDAKNGYKCVCPSNYSGKDCTVKVTPCSSNPCKNGGTCTNKANDFTCKCVTPFSGKTCETTTPCGSDPCKNGGKCTDSGKSFTCACEKPYSGPTCETSPCTKKPCQNGGTCKVGKAGFICTCKSPYKGPRCENGPCSPSPCQNNGTCNVTGSSYQCGCKKPFSGKNCETGPCSTKPCKNNGTCNVEGLNFKCKCEAPYSGETCDKGPCSSNPCLNQGKCEVNGKSFKCKCQSPFSGANCEIGPCSSNPCKNGGTCKVEGSSFKCDCKSPYNGETCEKDPCSSNPCLNNGTCKVEGKSFKCKCPSQFSGSTCEIGPCFSNPCQNNGTCKVSGQKFICECKPPYEGKNCETGPCSSNPCQNKGKCQVDKLSFNCVCSSPFKGKRCEIGPCTSKPCLNNGNCTVKENGFNCICKDPFFGDKCEKDPCSPSPCGNGGKCKIKGNSFTCDCPDKFVGEKCQYECNCKNGKCRVTSDEEVLCECLPEYGKYSGDCKACDCGTGANCTWEIGWISDTKYCLCPNGDRLKEKHCEDPCNSNPCSNNGKCKVDGKGFKCECKPPYTGLTCKDDLCTKNPCQNGATCKIKGSSFECNCKTPYSGNLCEKDPCSDNPCKDRGTCSFQGNSFKCNCTKPYFGEKCEKDPCTDNPCKDRGTCKLLGNSFKCNCSKPYFGDKCEKDPCTDNPCKDRGTCRLLGNSFKCNCMKPYFGYKCEKDPCTDNPCLNGGTCRILGDSFKCDCKKLYGGDKCQYELSTTTIPSTKKTSPTVSSTKEVINTSPLMSTTQVFTETPTRNFTEEINKTTNEPSNFTADLNVTTFEPSNFTNNFNWTTYEPSNFTVDFNWTTYEPSNFTVDFNGTTYQPYNFTSDFNNTTYEPSDYTGDFNNTTSEPSNFTTDFNRTTYEPSNFTTDFNRTTYEPSNYTGDFNITTSEPSNFTSDFNETTYESSKSTHDINMTSYEPSNTTNESKTSETTPFISTSSTPSILITTKKPDVCDNNPCQNGGTCKEVMGVAKCFCPPQYTGENCTDTAVNWCTEGEGKELCKGGGCAFDYQTKLGRCTCPDEQYYNYEKKQCEVVDRCPFMSIKCDETKNEVCKNGACQCKEDFVRKEGKCLPNFCALNPCGRNEVCEDIEKDPGYVKCKCKEGYIFDGEHCMEGNVCSIPGFMKCQQICNIDTGKCDCYSGFILQSDGKTCVPENSTQLCSKKCGVGVCNEIYDDICLCPPTHVYNGTTCVDLCTAGQIPEGLCPGKACVVDKEMVFKCKCAGKFTYDETGFTCRKKLMCTEGAGKEVCKKRNAICMEDFEHPDGFTCECEKGLGKDTDGTCKRKCELFSQQEECTRKGATCEMEESDAICKCPPLLKFGPDGRCSDFVNASYNGELIFALERYSSLSYTGKLLSSKRLLSPSSQTNAPDASINIRAIRHDLRESMHTLYGEKYQFADVLNCNFDNNKIKCLVELRFQSDPQDQLKLISDSNSCLSVDDNTCFIPPKLLIEKESQKTATFKETDPCSQIISKDYCGRDTECMRKEGLNFECKCTEGLESYSTFKPLGDPRTLIHYCQDIDECKQKTACPNTTTCFNTYKSYNCLCLKGFKPLAENSDLKKSGCVDVCYPNPCNHGTCEKSGEFYSCKCDGGFTGFDCSKVMYNTAGKEGMKTALIILSVLVVPLILFSGFMMYQYRVLKKRSFKSNYFDDTSSTINLVTTNEDRY